MRYVSATDAKQNFAALLDDAQRGPAVIRRQSRDQAVMISPQEYARLRGLAVADFEEFCNRVGREAVAARAVRRVLDRSAPLVSEATLGELADTF